MPKLEYKADFQPKQAELFEIYERGEATIIGSGGARGGSKSHGTRHIALLRRLMYANTGGLLMMRTLGDLRDNHIEPLLREVPSLRDYYNKNEFLLSLPNGSFIRFISADKYDDVFKLQGKEFADIMVDQSEQFSQEQLEFLGTCNRCTTNNDITPKMLFSFNPGNKSHQYNKRVFVKRSSWMPHEDPSAFAFVRTYGWDNVKWVSKALKAAGMTEADYHALSHDDRFEWFITRSNYGRRLNGLPESKKKAQLYGDFDVFEGQFFESWRHDLHVIKPIRNVPAGFDVRGAIDYGQRTVLTVGWRDYNGNIVIFGESYTEDMAPTERFNHMVDLLISRGLKGIKIRYDTNMDVDLSKYDGSDKTPAAIMRQVMYDKMGEDMPILSKVSKSSPNKLSYRAACNEAIRELLHWQRDAEGKYVVRPKLYITEDCTKLVETLPELMHDPKSPDGLDFDQDIGIDDPFDSAKYLIMSLRKADRPDEEEDEPQSMDEYMRQQFVRMEEKSLSRRSRRW